MEARYRETLTERHRAAAKLELELEKERQRVKGYKQALISQSQQLMEERKQLQQVKSCLAALVLGPTLFANVQVLLRVPPLYKLKQFFLFQGA